MDIDKGLIVPKTVPEMVDAYNLACEQILQAYLLLEEARVGLEIAFGKEAYFELIHERRKEGREAAKDIIFGIKKKVWKIFIDKIGVRKLMSSKKAEQLDKKLDTGQDMPAEVTVETVFETLNGFMAESQNFVEESIQEVFDYLRPGARRSSYKTNQKNGRFEIGPKIILGNIVSPGYGMDGKYRVNYWHDKDLLAIDRIFYAIDGNLASMESSYRSPLVDAIQTAEEGIGETCYFKFHCYQNGNLHLEFKRMDLVTKLNAVAGGKKFKEAESNE